MNCAKRQVRSGGGLKGSNNNREEKRKTAGYVCSFSISQHRAWS